MFTAVKPIAHSENRSTRKHAIGKKESRAGEYRPPFETFPSEPLRNIFSLDELKHCTGTSNAEETKFR